MNILYIAYSCSPYHGSEDQIGWSIPVISANKNHVFVITKQEHKQEIEQYLKMHKIDNISFYYVDIPLIYKKVFKGFLYSGRLNVWHHNALPLAEELCKKEDIKIIHQITPVEFRSVGDYGSISNTRFVCGPLGGGEAVPKGLRAFAIKYAHVEFLRLCMNFCARTLTRITGKMERCSYILFANNETQKYFGKYIDLHRQEVVTEIGINARELQLVPKKQNESCIFLVMGRLIYRKGHSFLLDALAEIPKNMEYQCRIVGSGSEMERLKKKCEEFSLNQHVLFVGNIPFEDVQKEYESADVLIMPSIRETTGVVLLEGMANGLPVVTMNRFGGAILLDQSSGWLFDGSTKKEYIYNLKEALISCIQERDEVKRRGQNAFRKSQGFTWEEKMNYYQTIYERVTQDGKAVIKGDLSSE